MGSAYGLWIFDMFWKGLAVEYSKRTYCTKLGEEGGVCNWNLGAKGD